MELDGTNIVHFTPPQEELLPNHRIFCAQPNCKSTFTNTGNYEMHKMRHHKIAPQLKNEERVWHCPESRCIYNESRDEGGRHFPNLRYLRQHYQKVHAPKEHVCGECGKRFITSAQLLSHSERVCGRKFVCNECGWDYSSMEALQTHGKRTGHVIAAAVKCDDDRTQRSIPRLKLKRSSSADDVKCNQHQQTQTEESHEATKRLCCITSVQTDSPVALQDATTSVSESCFSNELDSILRNIETQTERSLLHSNSNSAFFDLLAQSSNMYTQTCDDFLSELGLTDIQTQTNWSSISETEHKHQYASTSTSTGGAHDELLVSTETQTSFTQCLLDSCPIGADNTTDGGGGVFGNIQHTQHTQTCDMLLDDLFGAQENDLICGFQSTYTQTS